MRSLAQIVFGTLAILALAINPAKQGRASVTSSETSRETKRHQF